MAPRRRSERTKKEVEAEDIDATEIMSTPTRKRRRLNGTENAAQSPAPGSVPETVPSLDQVVPVKASSPDSVETKDDDAESEPSIDEIIANLKVARNPITASIELSNDLHARDANERPAFAKIAGRDWTLFVQQPYVHIGRAERPNHPQDGLTPASIPGTISSANTGSNFHIAIDLGPSREVSRLHASIEYNSDTEKWILTTRGRNALRVDDATVHKDHNVTLHSGSVIAIVGTQMLFILPNVEPVIHPYIKQQALADPAETSTDEETRSRRRNGRGFIDDRQFTDLDPFPPSSTGFKPYPQSAVKPRASLPGNTFAAAAFAGAPQPATPLASRVKERAPQSPGYARGVMMESTEDIDYSADSAKELKPPQSYAQLIGQAIMSSPDEMLTLAHIYQYIRDKYAFYRYSGSGWQNSIRHNLSLSKAFEKVARRTDEPGKGMKWKIVDDQRDEFIRKTLMNGRRGTARMGSSGPNSPAAGMAPSSHPGERFLGYMQRDNGRPPTSDSKMKSPQRSHTPPFNQIPQATEAYTPERGPRLAKGSDIMPPSNNGEQSRTPINSRAQHGTHPSYAASSSANVDTTSRLDRNPSAPDTAPGLRVSGSNSPPLYGTETSRANHLVTPLVARHAPRLAPPSTAQAPSQFMQLSSPAPFWRYADLGSTPVRTELSPSRKRKHTSDDESTPDIPPQPSSPPLPQPELDKDADEEVPEPVSPTRSMSRPMSRRQTKSGRERTLSSVSNSGIAGDKIPQGSSFNAGFGGVIARPSSTIAANTTRGSGVSYGKRASLARDRMDDEEEEGIDLAK
ncbi:hypothetical protein EJ05DRAFT_524870 [Pseudovirgaria hyperparasitica]|uniref:Fork-head domain-containing protein n=1 Tax=Pseudovirgaria hyperparasitica TaxID=470096 RepID=A0A6A6VQ78_9PEZI|nr:uncharacterized protein EJ05DRAFT_524870 [Pseudovirgaria hyperparasitica]KAF2752772.1 hypothetical protein EJ05DRAFT_524870 [Pseudovirgaria hyperparasitica]